jgi:hypothetical protein
MTYMVDLPKELTEALRAEAASVGIRETDLIRDILSQYVAHSKTLGHPILPLRSLSHPTTLEDLEQAEKEIDMHPTPDTLPSGGLDRAAIYDDAEDSER